MASQRQTTTTPEWASPICKEPPSSSTTTYVPWTEQGDKTKAEAMHDFGDR